MERRMTRESAVPLSLCDWSGRLSVQGVFSLFMDMATDHAGRIGVGLEDMRARGLFWLTVRTRVRIFRRPALGEGVTLATWPEKPGTMRCNRDYALRSGEELLAAGKTEWAVMDTAALRLRPVKDVYPPELTELLTDETVWDEPFARLRETGDGSRALGTYTVASTDIDVGGHMNNAAYVRMLLGAFSSRELEAMDVRDVELCYRAPCFEGETLTILAAPAGEGTDVTVLRPDGKTALLGRIR